MSDGYPLINLMGREILVRTLTSAKIKSQWCESKLERYTVTFVSRAIHKRDHIK